jgi:gluconolactonase
MYMTDPGYFGTPIANRIFRVANGQVTVVEAFEDVPRPNGIALSPDQKTLYVGFSAPGQGTIPFVRKYIVNDDGTLGEHAKFVDIGPEDSAPDGVEADQGGNVYVANKAGVSVFKSDGTKIGDIAVPDQPTGVAFGGKDLKTLYITTQGTKIYSVTINVPGIAQ